MLIGFSAWGVFSFAGAIQPETEDDVVTQADTALVADGTEADPDAAHDYQRSIRHASCEKLAQWTKGVRDKIEEQARLAEEARLAEAEKIAEEERLAEEARLAEAKRLEAERLAQEAAERERQQALARAAKEKERKSDSSSAKKLENGYFYATAYYPASETATTSTGENLMELIESGERIVACNDFPLNTILLINGKRWRVADRMGQSGYIDFLLGSEAEVYQFGMQKVKVKVAN